MLSHDVDLADVQATLVGWLQQKMPEARNLSISDLERSGAGFANVSIPFQLSWEEAGQQRSAGMFFRGAGKSDPVFPDFKLERQFRIMRCLQDTNVPVPRVYWMEMDESLFGFPFYIMSKIDGVVPSEYPTYHSFGICHDASPEQRARMWWGTLEAMANVHKLDWKRLGLSFLGVLANGTGPLDQELDYWEHYLDWAREEPQPILRASLDWLRGHRYAPARVSLCWGDARLPNTMFSPSGNVLAVLDWEMAILGDPECDLAFMIALDWLLSEGTGVPRLEGFPEKEETVKRYEELTGWKVENFSYNEVLATFRVGTIVLRVQKNLQKMGVALPGEDPILDNFCTRRLADLLHLPAPGASKTETIGKEALSGTVQLHLTGPGGGDWYIVASRGQAIRREGRAENPDATVTVMAEDWAAIQRGDMNPFTAWTSGRLQITGDDLLYRQLADIIAKAWD
jgi:aminoglycoside phosphotransferase (APT) family kinase protein/putative sterol carrier protein